MQPSSRSSRRHSWIRAAFIVPIGFLLFTIGLELTSLLILKQTGSKVYEPLLSHFPVQIRKKSDDLANYVPPSIHLKRPGRFHETNEFDPVLGFRRFDVQEWIGNVDPANRKKQLVVVAIGGGTTLGDNFPRYLNTYAKQMGADKDIVVFSAGLWAYSTQIEKNYLSSWILPKLESVGIVPDLVVTLDGVNDVWLNLASYYLAEKTGQLHRWNPNYHGFHFETELAIEKNQTLSGAFQNLKKVTFIRIYENFRSAFYDKLPATVRVLGLVFRGCCDSDGTPHGIEDLMAGPPRDVPEQIEDQIVLGFSNSLKDMYGMLTSRGIALEAYLQPVLLKEFYPHTLSEKFIYPSIDYMGIHLYRLGRLDMDLYTEFPVKTLRIFQKAEQMYIDHANKYKGHFSSYLKLLAPIENPEEAYDSKSGIAYGNSAKKLIAKSMVEDWFRKGHLKVKKN